MDESLQAVWQNKETKIEVYSREQGNINLIQGTRELLNADVDGGESGKQICSIAFAREDTARV